MPFDLEREALFASGIREEPWISEYAAKLDSLSGPFLSPKDGHPSILAQARRLFDGLWKGKPARYRPQGHYRLNHVIDAQPARTLGPYRTC